MKEGCGNCKFPEGTRRELLGFGSDRRCRSCLDWRKNHDEEAPPEMWPLFHKDRPGCQNSGRPETAGKGTLGFGETRRCQACHQYVNKYGEERPKHLWRMEYKFVPDKNVKTGCGNCGAEETIRSGWHGSGADRRCPACYGWRRDKKTERPEAIWAPRVMDGCKNCGKKEDNKIGSFWGFGDERRCRSCKQWSKRNKGEERPPHRWR